MKDKVTSYKGSTAARWLPKGLKYAFGVILFIVLASQLNQRLGAVSMSDLSISSIGISLILVVVLLSFANWSLEAIKWQVALTSRPTFKQALETVLVGLAFAVFTPGRVGDYVGRAIHADTDSSKEAFVGTFICSLSQLAVTIGAGMTASFFMLQSAKTAFILRSPMWLIIPLIAGLILFFQAEKITNHVTNISYFRKFSIKQVSWIPLSKKVHVLGLSLVRYTIYVAQMVILIIAFELKIPLLDAIFGVSILFLVQTMIPMPMVFQVATKIELAMILWSPFDPSPISLSLIMLFLWVINVAAAAVVGYRILNFTKIIKSQKHLS